MLGETLAIAGLVVSVLALGLGLLSVSRAVPPLHASLSENGNWVIVNPGPDTLVIVAAYVIDEDQQRNLSDNGSIPWRDPRWST